MRAVWSASLLFANSQRQVFSRRGPHKILALISYHWAAKAQMSLHIWIVSSICLTQIFYWPFQGGTSFVDLLCFCSVLCLLCFVRVCLYVLCGHLLGKGWPLGSRLWCLLWVCHFPIGILGQVWYLIVSIPDLCTITYFYKFSLMYTAKNTVYI